MEEAKTMKTPMSSSIKLDKNEKGKPIDSTMYRGMIDWSLGFGFGLHLLPLARHSQVLLHSHTPRVLIDGWLPVVTVSEPIFPISMQAFYLRATYGIGGTIISTVKIVKIRLDLESICQIFDIAPVGLRVTTRVLPYGRFLTRVFKDAGTSRETTSTGLGQGETHYRVEEKVEIGEMDDGVNPQRGFQQREPETVFSTIIHEPSHTEIPPHQAPYIPNHAPWMDLSAQISSLGTRMEEFAIVSDTRFYSMEDCMDQYRTGFTSQFEYL
ncbi:hypothetical protein CK203_082916 [Vitis vinifera]|uniref:Uncharacterized protein n=1 Tax=Vitis vinifera TaxID=29760 RepID=A0A438D6Z7_VITVI|nr:hypothetical protein CK203_082916 [Vitis vinifera]